MSYVFLDDSSTTGSEGTSAGVLDSATVRITGNSIVWDDNSQFTTGAGNQAGIKSRKVGHKRVGVGLYFKYVKSKLNKLEKRKLENQMIKLQAMVMAAEEADQQALYEELSNRFVALVRQAEIISVGFSTFIEREVIEKFLDIAKDDKELSSVKLDDLDSFPRIIPKDIRGKIKKLKEKNIFDNFHVLYLTVDKKKLKTTKEKIKEKDPILFGSLDLDPNKLFYIADWIDEYCDLTMDKFINVIKEKDIGTDPKKLSKIDNKFTKKLMEEVKTRSERLKNTNQRNYIYNMSREDEDRKNKKRGLFARFFGGK